MARNRDKHPDPGGKTRRQRLEELQQAEQRANRRRTLLIVGTAALLALVLILAVVIAVRKADAGLVKNQAVGSFGVAAAAASCDSEVSQIATGSGQHVDPSKVARVAYATVPPTFGEHYPNPAPFGRIFYSERDRPAMEVLVHNLEHGYTVVWYDSTVTGAQLTALESLSQRLTLDAGKEKLIVSAWDPSYGTFPAGKHIAFGHWTAKQGVRQLCGQVSGEALQTFMNNHPSTDAPEPNGA